MWTNCLLGGSTQVFTPLHVAFSSHFLCVEVQLSPQTAADEGRTADLLSSPGFAWEADLITTEYSTCLCCTVAESWRRSRAALLVLVLPFYFITMGVSPLFLIFLLKRLKEILDLSAPCHVCELLGPQCT